MTAVPEFMLRKLYVPGSLKREPDGFSFALKNTFAPATITGFGLEVDEKPVLAGNISIQPGKEAPVLSSFISLQSPFSMSVGVHYTIRVAHGSPGQGCLRLQVDTREAGRLSFTIKALGKKEAQKRKASWRIPRFFQFPLKSDVEIDTNTVVGNINPYIYGHFVEHLERCVYGGIWSEDGSRLRPDTLNLIRKLHPPLVRYPGGNFASGYHWEDGVGSREKRPKRFDAAWQAWESNQVGTDEFLSFCSQVGSEPFLVVNDGSGTPEEAACWVAYCNEPTNGSQGSRRAANGHPEPYGVRLWGVGNEVWGRWQIGHTTAEEYVRQLGCFSQAMRTADPSLRIVAVGDGIRTESPQDPGRLWNEVLLRQAQSGLLDFDYLSFHIYQPEQEGWRENYDPASLYHTVCAAPLEVEKMIVRLSDQIASLAPHKEIRIALDEWNLWLPAPEGSGSMHEVSYTLRDALYTAGVLNAFHRQCQNLSIANLAQLVNVLPAILTNRDKAFATPIYYPFLMYRSMQSQTLAVVCDVEPFDSQALGNIPAQQKVPYLDLTATSSEDRRRLTLGLVNRHPSRKLRACIAVREPWGNGFFLRPEKSWLLTGPGPLAYNSFEQPDQVKIIPASLPEVNGDTLKVELPPCSVSVIEIRTGNHT